MAEPAQTSPPPGTPMSILWPDGGQLVNIPALIAGVCLDSRLVRPGDLYVALPGRHGHGARFVGEATGKGAVAVLTDLSGAELAGEPGVPVVVVADPRTEMARVAAQVYGRPADALSMFGLTGTNGKTSTMFLLEAGLAAVGQVVGTIGTLGFRLAGVPLNVPRTTITTPESPDVHALLAKMRDGGASAVAMEVSSHALALDRVAEVTFDVSGFTHLGRDHLDFHQDMESYFAAKSRLFLGGVSRTAVVNTGGSWGRRLADLVSADGSAALVTTGPDPDADFRLLTVAVDEVGRNLVRMGSPIGELQFTVGMIGPFNADNAVLAAAMIHAAGLDLTTAVLGFAEASVPGRMQRVDLGPGAPRVVVDFAHTPEAVAAALAALPNGPRTVVLGAGGDRDAKKRGPMGAVAASAAELVVVTDDNPRSEQPADIRAAVLAGAVEAARTSGAEVVDGGDRRSAIAVALASSTPDGWVAILGKGHEATQDIGGRISPFDDVTVAFEEWAALHPKETADA